MSQTKIDFARSLIEHVKLVQSDLDAFRARLDVALDEVEAADTKLNTLLDLVEAAAFPAAGDLN